MVDSEKEKGIDRVYIFAMDTLDPKHLLENIDVVFDSLKCADKLNIAFSIVLRNVEDGSCRYYYAHEENTLSEWSKFLATTEDLTKFENLQSNTDGIETCTGERATTKWKFYKVVNAKILAAFFKEVPMGC